jgi:hypothetical protein
MIDYNVTLYNPAYSILGVPATFTAASTAGSVELIVIDDTRAKMQTSRGADVRSVGPGAFARIPELNAKGIARADYANATLSFSGRTWTVRSYEIRGSPNGEDLGEVRFFLMGTE